VGQIGQLGRYGPLNFDIRHRGGIFPTFVLAERCYVRALGESLALAKRSVSAEVSCDVETHLFATDGLRESPFCFAPLCHFTLATWQAQRTGSYAL